MRTARQIVAIPRINRGDPIRASFLNSLGAALNALAGVPAPRDVDDGLQQGEQNAPDVLAGSWVEVTRDSEIVRVTNPEDEDQYVDVSRAKVSYMLRPDGVVIPFRWLN